MDVLFFVLLCVLVVLNIVNMIFAMKLVIESKNRESEIEEKIIDLRNELIRFSQNKN